MRVVLLGPPGAGKGTQAERIVRRFGGLHLSSGELLRDHVERGTDLGRAAREYMDRGDLVPDELVISVMLERLAQPDAERFVLDGFPRTVQQAEALDRRLEELERPLDAVLALEVGERELRERLAGRAKRQDRTEDESEAVIRRRLEVYANETEPLLDYYSKRSLLARIDAEGPVDRVSERVMAGLTRRAR